MSADLWKEFGPGAISQASAISQDQPVLEESSRIDDWGDFEEAKTQNSSVSEELPSDRSFVATYNAPYTHFGKKLNSELLFDAETAQKSEQSQAAFSDQERNSEPGGGSLHPESGVAALNRPVTGLPQSPSDDIEGNVDEEWADFEAPIDPLHISSQKALSSSMDFPPTNTKDPAMAVHHTNSSGLEQGSLSTSPHKSLPPPSNIPPPSILLSLATSILPSLVANLKNLINSSTAAPHQHTHSVSDDPMTHHFSTLRAIARVVAGRKHRWKRDTLLAQSVKIGPSHGGRAGGMKLAGVDKMEGRREDQEVAELVRAWRQYAGPLKASISKLSKMNMGQNMSIPEISENQNARLVKGALTAPKPCAICGLKRDERLDKVDLAVEDSFGEYWEEHWGHVDCKKFWSTYHTELRQR